MLKLRAVIGCRSYVCWCGVVEIELVLYVAKLFVAGRVFKDEQGQVQQCRRGHYGLM